MISLEASPSDNSQEEQLENVYIGVSMIRLIFPDVTQISRAVLELFAELRKARESGTQALY